MEKPGISTVNKKQEEVLVEQPVSFEQDLKNKEKVTENDYIESMKKSLEATGPLTEEDEMEINKLAEMYHRDDIIN